MVSAILSLILAFAWPHVVEAARFHKRSDPEGTEQGLGSMLGLGKDHSHHAAASSPDVFPQENGQATMERVYLQYANLPVGTTQLRDAGWSQVGECDPHIGYAWTQDKDGVATQTEPLVLYTTHSGQVSGVGVVIRDEGSVSERQKKWTTKSPRVGYAGRRRSTVSFIDVAFRSGDILCNPGTSPNEIGDTLIVNPGGEEEYKIPLTTQEAASKNWYEGACFDGMGTHWFLDTAGGRPPTWSGLDLFPVVAMYDAVGKINAIFFVSFADQVSIPFVSANWWEPKSLSNSEMCANMCAGETCTFQDHDQVWSTMHIYFNDHKNVYCPQRDDQCQGTIPGFWGRVTCCGS